jgi:polar amino acid transport system permease protein
LTLRLVILPQAMRSIIPPTGNEVISMLKTTSLVTAVPYTLTCTHAQCDLATSRSTLAHAADRVHVVPLHLTS